MKPTLRAIAEVFFRIGISTFGSGSTTVILLSQEMTRRGWLDRSQADLCYTLARVVPGTNVFAFVTSAAWAVRGWRGSLAALLAISVPAALIVVLLSLAWDRWESHPVGGAFIGGATAAIVGIIVAAGLLLAAPRFVPGTRLRTACFVLGALLLSLCFAPLTVLAMAAVGGYFWREPS